jgi:tyrosyl-tRNA synthetase
MLRMSKSTGNHIGISEPAEIMYGKMMSIPDHAMRNFADLVTRWSPDDIQMKFGDLAQEKLHPRDLKMQLAFEIVDVFHGRAPAEAAQEHFRTVFQQRERPSEMPQIMLSGPVALVDLLTREGLAPSKSEARRLIQQGGVKLDGERVDEIGLILQPPGERADGRVLQVGRRRFLRVIG